MSGLGAAAEEAPEDQEHAHGHDERLDVVPQAGEIGQGGRDFGGNGRDQVTHMSGVVRRRRFGGIATYRLSKHFHDEDYQNEPEEQLYSLQRCVGVPRSGFRLTLPITVTVGFSVDRTQRGVPARGVEWTPLVPHGRVVSRFNDYAPAMLMAGR